MPSLVPSKTSAALERYMVLPMCLLVLNLCNEVISYKARLIHDGLLRILFIMGMVLFGASVVAFVISPAVIWSIQSLRRTGRGAGGRIGEVACLVSLLAVIAWLYSLVYLGSGVESLLPRIWWNKP